MAERLPQIAEDDDLVRAKKFWKKSGTSIIVGVSVGLAVVVGYNFWQSYAVKQSESASVAYNQLLLTNDLSLAITIANELKGNHVATIYAELAALDMAARYVNNNDIVSAQSQLIWVLDNADDTGIKDVARLRLALVYLQQGYAQQVIDLLETENNPGFASRYSELLGDAYALRLDKGDKKRAREAYQLSIETGGDLVNKPLVQLKIDRLGEI